MIVIDATTAANVANGAELKLYLQVNDSAGLHCLVLSPVLMLPLPSIQFHLAAGTMETSSKLTLLDSEPEGASICA
jgi:hypothetical protein